MTTINRASATGPEGAPRSPDHWLLLFRTAAAAVLLVGGAVLHMRSTSTLRSAPTFLFYLSLTGAFIFSLAAAAAMRLARRVEPGLLGEVQLVVDAVVTTTLVYSTGGQDSVLTFLYPLNTLYAAALVSRPAGYAVAATGAFSFAGLVALQTTGLLGRIDEPGLPFDREALSVVTATVGANFLVAMLAGQLSEQLRRSGETLTKARLDLRTLQLVQSAMVQSLQSGLLSVDARGTVQLANPAAERVLGLPKNGLLLTPLRQLLPDLPERLSGGMTGREMHYTRPDGSVRQLAVSISALQGLPADEGGAVVVLQDVTEQRQLEAAIALSRRLATVGQFAAGLAHELRNPLGSMIGCVELLKLGAKGSGDDERLLNIVHREAERLARLVGDFLQFARPQLPELHRVLLRPLLEEVAEDCARDVSLQARVRVQCEPGLCARADGSQLRQVLWNLLRNASQVAPGEEILLSAEPATLHDAPGIRISVTDRGPGVPPDVEKRLFEPFFTTRPDGTGLGLAIVHRIVEAHGGLVGVIPAGRPGATFHVTLQEHLPDASSSTEPPAPREDAAVVPS